MKLTQLSFEGFVKKYYPREELKECDACNGEGMMLCPECSGFDFEDDCDACSGFGVVECEECGGLGYEDLKRVEELRKAYEIALAEEKEKIINYENRKVKIANRTL